MNEKATKDTDIDYHEISAAMVRERGLDKPSRYFQLTLYLILLEVSPLLPHTCPDRSAHLPGCLYSLVWKDAPCQSPSPSPPMHVGTSPLPPRTCPDRSALPPACSCSIVCQDVPCPTPSLAPPVLFGASFPPPYTCPDPFTPMLVCSWSPVCR